MKQMWSNNQKKKTGKLVMLLVVFTIACTPLFAQKTFNLKELITLRSHNAGFFRDYVSGSGYNYLWSKYEEKRQIYTYALQVDAAYDLRKIVYKTTDKGASVTYGTTDSSDYQEIKRQLEVLQFHFVKYVPRQEEGRSVLEIVYSDGNIRVSLYNSYIQDDNHDFARYYRIKVM